MRRRRFLSLSAAALGAGALRARAGDVVFEVTRSEAEWKAMLTPQEFAVMREEATERAFTSPLDKNYAPGTYLCRGCDLPLYASEAKFDSGTGWPSFFEALPEAVGTRQDRSFFMLRTECHCRRCGSHLGHIFDDAPGTPTGQRYYINSVSLKFTPTPKKEQ